MVNIHFFAFIPARRSDRFCVHLAWQNGERASVRLAVRGTMQSQNVQTPPDHHSQHDARYGATAAPAYYPPLMHPVGSHYTQQSPVSSPNLPEPPSHSQYTQPPGPPEYSPRSLHTPQTHPAGQTSAQRDQEQPTSHPQPRPDADSDSEVPSTRKRSQPDSEGQAEPQPKRAKGKAKAASEGTTTSTGTHPRFLIIFSDRKNVHTQRGCLTWSNIFQDLPGAAIAPRNVARQRRLQHRTVGIPSSAQIALSGSRACDLMTWMSLWGSRFRSFPHLTLRPFFCGSL